MRRLAPIVLAISMAVAAGGCGDEAGEPASPLDNALAYLPADAPLAVAISTDLDSTQHEAAGSILDRFPFGDQAKEALAAHLEERLWGEFEADLRPLLGEELVIGVAEPAGFEEDVETYLMVLPVTDAEEARALLEGDPELEPAGESSGASVYERPTGEALALEGEAVVAEDSREELDAALARRDGDDGLTEETFEAALDDLPEDALARLYGDARSMLAAHPEFERARGVPWLGALRALGATATADGAGLHLDLALTTDPSDLEEGDLPIATGTEAPPVGALEEHVGVGLRDPSQSLEFAMRVAEGAGAENVGGSVPLDSDLGQALGVDLQRDVLDQLTGDASVSLGLEGDFGATSELNDPATFERTLDEVSKQLPKVGPDLGLGEVAVARPGGGENLYALATPDGDRAVFGIVGGQLVLARDPAGASELAALPPAEVPDASGAATLVADAEAIASQLVERLAGGLGGLGADLFGGPLGTIHGSIEASTERLRGEFLLEIE